MKYDCQSARRILELSHNEAKAYFLKHESYFSQDLPTYFRAGKLLKEVDEVLGDKRISDFFKKKRGPQNFEGVNHKIVANKDGKLSWRPFQLMHPVLYVDLVREITSEVNWEKLCARFRKMHSNDKILCLSMPRQAKETKDRAESVNYWWREVELASVEAALDFELVYETDITDCYGSVYTHSIAWAVETKPVAKVNRNETSLIGVYIDKAMQNMQHGQTNGIPQGSALMDFIAELVLGYVDIELSEKIAAIDISDYKILRYRDDYRIFVNNSEAGEKIMKILAEVLADIGMRLNSSKTGSSDDVVGAALKKDKKAWITKRNEQKYPFKQMMLIKLHAEEFPNSGSLRRALTDFKKRIEELSELDVSGAATISVIVDIAYKHPTTYPVCFAILSKYFSLLDEEKRDSMIQRVQTKFTRLPNVGYMEVWFQRAIKNRMDTIDFFEPLCKLVQKEEVELWNSDWIDSPKLRGVVDPAKLVDWMKLEESDEVISNAEYSLFEKIYG